jgi:hypothetical protein
VTPQIQRYTKGNLNVHHVIESNNPHRLHRWSQQ